MKWSEEMEYISNKISKGIGINKAKNAWTDKVNYSMLWFTHIWYNYCIEVCSNACNYIFDPLSKVQKIIIDLIYNFPYTFSTIHVFTALNIMSLNSIYIGCVFIYV